MSDGLLAAFSNIDRAALIEQHGAGIQAFSEEGEPFPGIGPIVELATMAQAHALWSAYAKTNLPANVAIPLRLAHRNKLKTFFGSVSDASIGVMCLTEATDEVFRPALLTFDLAARQAMRFKRNVARSRALVCGAIGEMVDNVLEHSGATNTGIVAYAASASHFDVSVSDAGMGVLASLRLNPGFAYLSDAGMALSLAIRDGTSRYPTAIEGGHGHGFSTLFRGLNSLDAEVRLRSGDYALEVGGRGVQDRAPAISQKAHLAGLVVSFRIYH